ncbi:Helix-turn-helix [Nakamurella panacisegetis]|uniref:Helix-turn-helix n=1 Tax=Nakamurella panacisegetis TaxID=1090615 RepID=A0A1H0QSA5_9ACTN|nr:helix-turn-helix transcriptional regulator [Nakamurella panacisegetis]SDP19609.1 Helix-turn-helix [Nakamurella panacisegetis]
MDADQESQVVELFPRRRRPEPLWRELVGQVLRSERIEQGRTLQQVAERAGLSPQYLSEVERGRKDSSSEMLESICGAMGLRLSDLLSASSRTLHGVSAHPGRPTTMPAVKPAGPTVRPAARPTTRPSGVTSMAA